MAPRADKKKAKKKGGGLCSCLFPAGEQRIQQKRASAQEKKATAVTAAQPQQLQDDMPVKKIGKDAWRASRRISYRMTNLDVENIYDVVIVGGGFSGGYCAWQLHEARPDLRIAILEREVDVGGRLFSDENDDNERNMDELGGMRVFPSVQPAVAAVVKEMGCHLVPIRLEDSKNWFYYEGRRVRKKDFKLSSGRTPDQMFQDCRAAYRAAMPEDAALPWDKAVELRNLSLTAFLRKYGASAAEVDEFFAYSGYDIFSHPKVAANSYIKEGDLYGAELDADQHYVQEGFEQVVHRMVERSGAKVGLSCEVEAVMAPDPGTGLCEVVYTEKDKAGKQRMYGRRVVLGLPQKSALALAKTCSALSPRRVELIRDSVQALPLFKCFLTWDHAPGEKQWWEKLGFFHGKSTTDLEIRQIHYYDSEDVLLYSSGEYAEFWDREFRADWRKAARKMFEQIKRVHGEEADMIPEPRWDGTIFRFWDGASMHWSVGFDIEECMHLICHGGKAGQDVKSDSPVFLVGDAFAASQGWTVGCIETSDMALSHLLAVI